MVSYCITLICLCLSFNFLFVNGARKRDKIPLIDEYIRANPNWPTHCIFGNVTYDLEERWKPNLGQPFGLLSCVICECLPVQRKNRVIAKVKCKNIIHNCPKPACDEPILLPKRCCKVCPGQESINVEDEIPIRKAYRNRLRNENSTSSESIRSTEKQSSTSIPSTLAVTLPTSTTLKSNRVMDDDSNDIVSSFVSNRKCYYEDNVLDDGSQWRSSTDECDMCFCHRGRIKCEQMVCPMVMCENPVKVAGECCPSCSDNSTTDLDVVKPKGCYFEGDRKFHNAGSKWHPYLPPFGFDRCSLCQCVPDTLSIRCKRIVSCPVLTCPEEDSYRENALDCCKRCPSTIVVKSLATKDELNDQRVTPKGKSPNEILAAGGCVLKRRVYTNGDEWHPYIAPFGEMRCVKCRCKNKKVKCSRTKCPTPTCSNPKVPPGKCCAICKPQTAFKPPNN